MSDVIATIWDFDKTLINGYMQDPIFEDYKINSEKFWEENNSKVQKLKDTGLEVNNDTFYLNQMLRYVRNGKMPGLNNTRLKTYGEKQNFYDGVIELFQDIKNLSNKTDYKNNGILFENYIVSSGLKKVIEGTELVTRHLVDGIWGCEFAEENGVISDIAYSIDNTTKTRALFEINKGANIKELNLDVNSAIPADARRVQFVNMIYVADGPSDIPAFSVINQHGGCTFAVYPKGDEKALKQVDKMRRDGRVQMYAEADYTEGSTAYMWIMEQLTRQADEIVKNHKATYQQYGKGTPKHLI